MIPPADRGLSKDPASDRRVLVIGYGNTLRSDDGLGWVAAERLMGTFPPEQVTVMSCHQLTMELAEPLSEASLVLLIDAQEAEPPGAIGSYTVVPDETLPDSFTHYTTPGALLTFTQKLYNTIPRTVMFTINGATFDIGEELSPVVEEALPKLLDRLTAVITEALSD